MKHRELAQHQDCYHGLRGGSINGGEIDPAPLLDGANRTTIRNPSGSYQLFRIGDSVAHRNIHAAIYEARRLALAI
ncbi:MAG TPA: hypothetical protein VFE19_07450 [Jatrophihabitantaceae bacterium]|nr:hypothetical protein [Jatrophihabitantaceae bacterium]